jgi:hypothetical protein
MSRKNDFKEDIIQSPSRSARRPDSQHNPFDDDDPFENAAQVGPSSEPQFRQLSGGQHGYTLDPFFDE